MIFCRTLGSREGHEFEAYIVAFASPFLRLVMDTSAVVDQLNQLNPESLQTLAKPSVNFDAQEHWSKCNPTGLSAELQRLGDFRAYNEQARLLTTSSFTSAKVSFAMVLHCISILHPVVLRVHTDYRLDYIVRCNYHVSGGAWRYL